MKLMIAIPCMDFVHVEFLKCLTALERKLKNDGVPFEENIVSGTLVYMARDKIACKAINDGFSHVMWLDSDMIFQPQIVEDLLDAGKSFVTGIYHARRPGFSSCIFKECYDLNHLERFSEYPRDIFEIGGCGFGCVLTEVDVIRQVQEHFRTCFTPVPNYGEDIAFCNRVHDLGIKMWCEPTVRCGHIGHNAVWPEDEEKWKNDLLLGR